MNPFQFEQRMNQFREDRVTVGRLFVEEVLTLDQASAKAQEINRRQHEFCKAAGNHNADGGE